MPANDASTTTISPDRANARPTRPARERCRGRLRTSSASAVTKSARGSERLPRSSLSRSSCLRFQMCLMLSPPLELHWFLIEIPPVAGKPLHRVAGLPCARPRYLGRDDVLGLLVVEDRPQPAECAMEGYFDGVGL